MKTIDPTSREIIRAAAFIEAANAIDKRSTLHKEKLLRMELERAADQLRRMAVKTRVSATT